MPFLSSLIVLPPEDQRIGIESIPGEPEAGGRGYGRAVRSFRPGAGVLAVPDDGHRAPVDRVLEGVGLVHAVRVEEVCFPGVQVLRLVDGRDAVALRAALLYGLYGDGGVVQVEAVEG